MDGLIVTEYDKWLREADLKALEPKSEGLVVTPGPTAAPVPWLLEASLLGGVDVRGNGGGLLGIKPM